MAATSRRRQQPWNTNGHRVHRVRPAAFGVLYVQYVCECAVRYEGARWWVKADLHGEMLELMGQTLEWVDRMHADNVCLAAMHG